MDIEFLIQTLQRWCMPTAIPAFWIPTPTAALERIAAAGFLVPDDAPQALDLPRRRRSRYQALTQILRIALDETLKAEEATPGLKELLARAGGAADFARAGGPFDSPLQDREHAIFTADS